MASGNSYRTLTAHFGSMGKCHDHPVDSPTRFQPSSYKQPLNAKQSAGKPAADRPKGITFARVVVIEQWICFLLGVVCIVCGAFAILATHIEGPPAASVAWLGWAYTPSLRVTALLCLFMGLLLVRRGWSRQDRERKGAKMKRDPENIPMPYVVYVVLGILVMVAGTVIFIIRLF